MDWALQGAADPEQRKHVITGLVRGWAESSFDETGAFVNALPAGPDRDSAVLLLARLAGAYDSKAQMQWADSISDPELRMKTMAAFQKEIDDYKRRFPKRSE
jgi:hypothetical protein